MRVDIPIWEKSNLSFDEAAAYTGVGVNKLRELSNQEDCNFVIRIGSKKMLKRKKLDEFIDEAYSL
jgi:hypothetical protein